MERAGRVALLALWFPLALAHKHPAVVDIDPKVPIDWIMYTHMAVQTFVWAILFPIGMVLGLSKSRFHVPVQAVGVVATLVGSYLGHNHGGREFAATVHGIMAQIIFWVLMVQTACGVFLRLHILNKTVRPWIRRVHGPLGMAFPIIGWTQIIMGVVTALGFCRGGEINQCLAHYIMGSAFIAYAAILVIMLNLGGAWLQRRGCSQEMLDSSVILVWGIINTFTEHQGGPWTHKDMQHTMMGVLWWAGGLLGVFLSRKGKRSFVPAVIIIMTGWGMSAHEQELMISSKASLVPDSPNSRFTQCSATPSPTVRIFQHLPPYLLVLSGITFISATNEEMKNANALGIDHVTYALFDFSLSFLVYLVITFLVHLYSNSGRNAMIMGDGEPEAGYAKLDQRDRGEDGLPDGPEVFELTEAEGSQDGSELTGDSDAVKIGGEDEVDWMQHDEMRGGALRL
ncbi:uncharacterized protein CcaverHIS019_0100270 [Cutaneotrichosporon cavernicola]|uniref:Integral membrane protein n=1 Tax=Cutaneotrichosporon cavernicola TaxID=279322 RepID=A0AA48HXG1_9TREE|nr:uncharacterized protein CcaverHIS019_0100270 [Cutaneotrichosporon cavernicola]BEI87309.1 hypothetical protein CcaverHIS019_0100270 [Cutaneotrichosporon cavernicola]BEJ02853.1 hypothetical protein CcaverHIS641_0100280 [Cutaneotrichosporon cavernicola]